ncbi:peroxide stress protein YaaA [Sphingomonas montana]|uniref:peroxide stress protein YaaA n=1 Tax=Sphingomonas montana TaxID=1843236 RepID=UPI00096DB8B7|nr:peroxide stress protein YaaA [Sphingomonas montana]
MIAVLSPAKSLDYESAFPSVDPTEPRFAHEAEQLAAAAAKLTKPKLAKLMHISDTLAALNVSRFRGFMDQPERPAIYAFDGDVYTGFEARSLEPEAIGYAQDHVRILSGLYGLLRPLDLIRPYRLEMGVKWAPGRTKDVYAHWGARIADLLARDLHADGSGIIVNLASQEYWGAVAPTPPAGARILTIDFREDGPKGLRFNSFGAKRARGMMARYICEHRIADVAGLKTFDSDGYAYTADGSDDAVLRFVRTR